MGASSIMGLFGGGGRDIVSMLHHIMMYKLAIQDKISLQFCLLQKAFHLMSSKTSGNPREESPDHMDNIFLVAPLQENVSLLDKLLNKVCVVLEQSLHS